MDFIHSEWWVTGHAAYVRESSVAGPFTMMTIISEDSRMYALGGQGGSATLDRGPIDEPLLTQKHDNSAK